MRSIHEDGVGAKTGRTGHVGRRHGTDEAEAMMNYNRMVIQTSLDVHFARGFTPRVEHVLVCVAARRAGSSGPGGDDARDSLLEFRRLEPSFLGHPPLAL